jgi:SAM-dependent methyltransferase
VNQLLLGFKSKVESLLRHPQIVKDVIQGKSRDEIRAKVRELTTREYEIECEKEVFDYISFLKLTQPYSSNPNSSLKLNKLCHIEDWQNNELSQIITELQYASSNDYMHGKGWNVEKYPVNDRKGSIYRKDWEWGLGVIAMKRFGKLTKESKAIGVGSATEEILFYLANRIDHVYATDLYDGKGWKNLVPTDFPENPKKYSPYPYNENALTVMRMDATRLEFSDESFDIAFSFSSIEHFGGENHSGALRSTREMERVLKPGGIAVVATEYMLNDKEHVEFFNRRTIYSDLIDKLDRLKLVEPLDLRTTTKTLDAIIDYQSSVNWLASPYEFKKSHPYVLIRINDLLVTSVMLVFQKQ